ncbi:hypothetical protein ACVWZ4_002956 [Bradyrhizobium sp. USDA 4472]
MLKEAAREHDSLDERLDYEMTAKLVRDDHHRQRTAAETTDFLGERGSQQAELRKRLPLRAAVTFLAHHDLAASIEVIVVAQQALNAGSEQFLLFRELDIHSLSPVPPFVRYRPSTALAMMLRWISLDPP